MWRCLCGCSNIINNQGLDYLMACLLYARPASLLMTSVSLAVAAGILDSVEFFHNCHCCYCFKWAWCIPYHLLLVYHICNEVYLCLMLLMLEFGLYLFCDFRQLLCLLIHFISCSLPLSPLHLLLCYLSLHLLTQLPSLMVTSKSMTWWACPKFYQEYLIFVLGSYRYFNEHYLCLYCESGS